MLIIPHYSALIKSDGKKRETSSPTNGHYFESQAGRRDETASVTMRWLDGSSCTTDRELLYCSYKSRNHTIKYGQDIKRDSIDKTTVKQKVKENSLSYTALEFTQYKFNHQISSYTWPQLYPQSNRYYYYYSFYVYKYAKTIQVVTAAAVITWIPTWTWRRVRRG